MTSNLVALICQKIFQGRKDVMYRAAGNQKRTKRERESEIADAMKDRLFVYLHSCPMQYWRNAKKINQSIFQSF